MPTYELTQRFLRDYDALDQQQQEAFRRARRAMGEDLRAGRGFRRGLQVTRVAQTAEVWEMAWAPDGRATWQYGPDHRPGEPHVIWRRVGTHEFFRSP